LPFRDDFQAERANQGEAGNLIRKPGIQERQTEDVPVFFFLASWLPYKNLRSSPRLSDSVVISVLVAALPCQVHLR
jgi:hypothetical protein